MKCKDSQSSSQLNLSSMYKNIMHQKRNRVYMDEIQILQIVIDAISNHWTEANKRLHEYVITY